MGALSCRARQHTCVASYLLARSRGVFPLWTHRDTCADSQGQHRRSLQLRRLRYVEAHFAWHFVLGETDYMVVPIPWEYFTIDYEKRGSSITEQELNLTPDEASRLVSNLIENSQPQNRVYRYSFLYGNCTTKVRDVGPRHTLKMQT